MVDMIFVDDKGGVFKPYLSEMYHGRNLKTTERDINFRKVVDFLYLFDKKIVHMDKPVDILDVPIDMVNLQSIHFGEVLDSYLQNGIHSVTSQPEMTFLLHDTGESDYRFILFKSNTILFDKGSNRCYFLGRACQSDFTEISRLYAEADRLNRSNNARMQKEIVQEATR